MIIYLTIDSENKVTSYGNTPIGSSNEFEIDVPEDHEILKNPFIFKFINGELIKDTDFQLNRIKENKKMELDHDYKSELTSGVISSLIGSDGKNIVFDYEINDQVNYSKRANTLALDTSIETFQIGTRSHGAITMTRENFITFMRDCDNHEMTLYNKLINLKSQVDEAKTIDEVNAISW